ncbi:MAG: hypothetical protein N3A66_01130, partial [Planctomycetota bacterium]|nr:hypothetical protein [Planctomycetota bacterium]
MKGNSYRLGRMAEKIAEVKLREMGFVMIEKVEPARTSSGVYLRQCSGDFRAVMPPDGVSVLVEVKYR